VKPEILLAYLGRFRPDWSEELRRRVAAATDHYVRSEPLAIDLAPFYAPDRQQYHATHLLAELLRNQPPSGGRIVGITAEDLFIPVLTFVFGQAQLGGPAAVVSVMRLHTEFYGLPADDRLLVDRAVKEVIHELGHGFGLVHCPDSSCVMSSSTYVEDVDLKGERFCTECSALLLSVSSTNPAT
jgi:archaemetzincin